MLGVPESYTFCLPCGSPGPHGRRCIDCGIGIELAPAIDLAPRSFAARIPQKGEPSTAVLLFRHPSGFVESVDGTGRFTPVHGTGPENHSVVGGLEVVRSFAGALVWAMSEVLNLNPRSFPDIYRQTFQRNLLNQGEVRRAAIELARAGLVEFIPYLELTNTEIQWWSILAHIRLGQYQAALELLATLPENRYPLRMGLTKALEIELGILSPSGNTSVTESDDVANRRISVAMFKSLAKTAGIDPLTVEKLASNRLPTSALEFEGKQNSSTLLFIENIRSTSAIDSSTQINDGFSLSLLDDLIDSGIKVPLSVFAELSSADRTYLTGRLRPEQLSEQEVADLKFKAEEIRRRVIAGDVEQLAEMEEIPQDIRARAQFARDKTISETMRVELPNWVAAIETFANSGDSLRAIPPEITREGILWSYGAEVLGQGVTAYPLANDDPTRQFLSWACLNVAQNFLYERKTDLAIEAAKAALMQAQTEKLKDEALNLIACAHWLDERDSEAIAALQNALAGNRNESLQVNLGVVASTSNPETAALELARLVSESDSLELRSNAAMRAAGMWLNDENPWKSDVKDGMPSAIRDALRIIVAEPIPIETFVLVAGVLSREDSDWLANKSNLGRSPHGGTTEARVLCARAAGFDQFIAELTSVLRQPNPSQWVIDERDNFVDALINQSKSDFDLGAALFLANALDKGLPVIDKHRILISPLSVLEMCAVLDPEKGEPQDRFFTDLLTTQNRFSNHEDYSALADLYQMAWDRLTAIHCLANHKLLLRLGEIHDDGVNQLSKIPAHQIEPAGVRQFFSSLVDDSQVIERSLRRFVGKSSDTDIQKMLADVMKFATELRTMCQQNMR